MFFTVTIVILSLSIYGDALNCNQRTMPPTFRGDERPSQLRYNDIPLTNMWSLRSDCDWQILSAYVQCAYSVILGDGVTVPIPPDLNSSSYFGYFIAWTKASDNEYAFLDFELSEAVSAIELSFFNNPARRIGLPSVELHTLHGNSRLAEESTIASTIIDNQDLAETDNEVKTVTIRPATTLGEITLRIRFRFTDAHEFDWLFLSEIRFCTEPQPSFQPSIIFYTPLQSPSIVQPNPSDLKNGWTKLVCTVSNEGTFTWNWKRRNSEISTSGTDYTITIGDGSRTTALTISNLNFNDAGEYECIAKIADFSGTEYSSSVNYLIRFPEYITTIPQVKGDLQTARAILTCELHGYVHYLPPLWLGLGGNQTTDSTKYTITVDEGNLTAVFENGTTTLSVIVYLTIHDLSLRDEGNYTCHGASTKSTTQLLLAEGTESPIIQSPTVPSMTIKPSSTLTIPDVSIEYTSSTLNTTVSIQDTVAQYLSSTAQFNTTMSIQATSTQYLSSTAQFNTTMPTQNEGIMDAHTEFLELEGPSQLNIAVPIAVSLLMAFVILFLLLVVCQLWRKTKKLSPVNQDAVQFQAHNNAMISNFEASGHNESDDPDYETIQDKNATKLTRNPSYARRHLWLPNTKTVLRGETIITNSNAGAIEVPQNTQMPADYLNPISLSLNPNSGTDDNSYITLPVFASKVPISFSTNSNSDTDDNSYDDITLPVNVISHKQEVVVEMTMM